MGKLIVRRGDEVVAHASRHVEINGRREATVLSKLYFNPRIDPVMLRVVEYAPGYAEPRHSHSADEIVYVISGEVDIDGETYRAGDALWIGARTEYGPLKAGPQGMTFLLVRQSDADYVAAAPTTPVDRGE